MTIPQAIMDEARKLMEHPLARPYRSKAFAMEIALALSDAEHRGAERERERAAKIAESNDAFPSEGEHIAAAIRNTKD